MKAKIRELALALSRKKREARSAFFRNAFNIDRNTKILDLGSQDGEHLRLVLGDADYSPCNIYLADVNEPGIENASKSHGFNFVRLDEDKPLPFDDGFFDIVFCSSVIEHVTVPKREMWDKTAASRFDSYSWERQKEFAAEIRRIGKGYFVQTPNRNFPIESHTWLPAIQFLPRKMQIDATKLSNKFWIIYTIPDFRLLTIKEMRVLFPDADIEIEKSGGLVKSIMAIKKIEEPN